MLWFSRLCLCVSFLYLCFIVVFVMVKGQYLYCSSLSYFLSNKKIQKKTMLVGNGFYGFVLCLRLFNMFLVRT